MSFVVVVADALLLIRSDVSAAVEFSLEPRYISVFRARVRATLHSPKHLETFILALLKSLPVGSGK